MIVKPLMSKAFSRTKYHIGVIPASGSSCRDDDVLMSGSPVQDGFDGAPRVEHVIKVAPVITSLTDSCVVGLEAQKCSLFWVYAIIFAASSTKNQVNH